MDTVNWEGWLPREQILGEEAASKVPKVMSHVIHQCAHVIPLGICHPTFDQWESSNLFPDIESCDPLDEGTRPAGCSISKETVSTDTGLV